MQCWKIQLKVSNIKAQKDAGLRCDENDECCHSRQGGMIRQGLLRPSGDIVAEIRVIRSRRWDERRSRSIIRSRSRHMSRSRKRSRKRRRNAQTLFCFIVFLVTKQRRLKSLTYIEGQFTVFFSSSKSGTLNPALNGLHLIFDAPYGSDQDLSQI